MRFPVGQAHFPAVPAASGILRSLLRSLQSSKLNTRRDAALTYPAFSR